MNNLVYRVNQVERQEQAACSTVWVGMSKGCKGYTWTEGWSMHRLR